MDTDHIGTVKAFAGTVIPTNWMLADGSSLSRVSYPELFAVIGTKYGAADGNTFSLPDLKNKFIYGANAISDPATPGGVANVTLTAAESGVQSHGHGINDPTHSHPFRLRSAWDVGGTTAALASVENFVSALGAPVNYAATGVTVNNHPGANATAAHTNMPPYLLMAQIIKVTGAQIDSGGTLVGPTGPPSMQAWVNAGVFPAGPWPQNVTISLPFKADVLISCSGTCFASVSGVRGVRNRWDGGDMAVSAMLYMNEISSHKLVHASNVVRAAAAGNHTLTFGPYATGSETSDSGDRADYSITAVQVP